MTHNSPVQEIWFHAHAHHSTLIKETLHEKKSKIFQKRTNKQTVQLVFLSNVIYWSCSIYIWFRIHCSFSIFYKYRHFSWMANRILNFVLCPLLQIKGGFDVKFYPIWISLKRSLMALDCSGKEFWLHWLFHYIEIWLHLITLRSRPSGEQHLTSPSLAN